MASAIEMVYALGVGHDVIASLEGHYGDDSGQVRYAWFDRTGCLMVELSDGRVGRMSDYRIRQGERLMAGCRQVIVSAHAARDEQREQEILEMVRSIR